MKFLVPLLCLISSTAWAAGPSHIQAPGQRSKKQIYSSLFPSPMFLSSPLMTSSMTMPPVSTMMLPPASSMLTRTVSFEPKVPLPTTYTYSYPYTYPTTMTSSSMPTWMYPKLMTPIPMEKTPAMEKEMEMNKLIMEKSMETQKMIEKMLKDQNMEIQKMVEKMMKERNELEKSGSTMSMNSMMANPLLRMPMGMPMPVMGYYMPSMPMGSMPMMTSKSTADMMKMNEMSKDKMSGGKSTDKSMAASMDSPSNFDQLMMENLRSTMPMGKTMLENLQMMKGKSMTEESSTPGMESTDELERMSKMEKTADAGTMQDDTKVDDKAMESEPEQKMDESKSDDTVEVKATRSVM